MKYPGGHEFEFKVLRPSQMKSDKLYQRKLDEKRIKRIADEWNGDIVHEIKVSYRDGQYWIFDGQHTMSAWSLKFGDKPMLCKVYKGMTWLDECEAFLQQNGISVPPDMRHKLRAMNNAHYKDVDAMIEGAEANGYKVDFRLRKNENTIVAVSALYKAYKELGYEKYVDMLRVIHYAWYGDHDAITVSVLGALTTFYKTFDGSFKPDVLASALSKVKPAEIIRNGRAEVRRNKFCWEIAKIYNKGRSKGRVNTDLL